MATPCCSGAAARTPRRPTSPPSCARSGWRSGPTCPGCSAPTRATRPPRACLRALHYDEAQEIATSGAKVLHPRCILPGAPVPHPAARLCHPGPGAGGHGARRRGRRRRRAGQGGVHQEGHHAGVDGEPGHVAPGRLPRRCLPGVQEPRHVGGPRVHLRDQRHRLAGSGRQHARQRARGGPGGGAVAPVPRAGDRAVRLGEPGRAQHPRHPAPARRRLRVLRGTEDLPGQPGGQRPELHLRRGREPGRPPGRAAARAADPPGARGPRARAHLAAAVLAAPGQALRGRALVAPAAAWICSPPSADRDAAFVYDLDQVRSAAARAARPECHRARALLDEGQPAPRGAQGAARGGDRVRVRLARGGRAAARAVPGPGSRAHPLHPELRRGAPSTPGRSEPACASPSTTPTCSPAGRICSRATRSSCASTPASAAATTTTCAPPARAPSSACSCPSRACSPGLPRPPARASSGCRRTWAAGCSMSPAGSTPRACWPRPPGDSRTSGSSMSAAASACRSTRSSRAWTWASSTRCCMAVRAEHPQLEVWLEPGRYLVATAGVLLARVTQLKSKGGVRFVGVATGMNSLIRPALYGSYHEIVNLTRLDEPATELVNVVGPICESADVLGHDRLLPVDARGRRAADRQRRGLRARDELALQPARAGAGAVPLKLKRLRSSGACCLVGAAVLVVAGIGEHLVLGSPGDQAVRGPALDAAGAGVCRAAGAVRGPGARAGGTRARAAAPAVPARRQPRAPGHLPLAGQPPGGGTAPGALCR